MQQVLLRVVGVDGGKQLGGWPGEAGAAVAGGGGGRRVGALVGAGLSGANSSG